MVESIVEVFEPQLNRVISLTEPVKPLSAAVVPIRVFFRGAGIGTREPLSQVFFLVVGGRVKIQKLGSREVTNEI